MSVKPAVSAAGTALGAARRVLRDVADQAFFDGAPPAGRRFEALRSGGARLALGMLFLSGGLWCLMNVRFQPRHGPAPFTPDIWPCVSLACLLALAAVLFAVPKSRRLAVFPLLFAVFPAAFLAAALWGGALRTLIPGTPAGNFLEWKFVYDCAWVTLELSLTALILARARAGSPFKPAPRTARALHPLPARRVVRAWEVIFICAVLALLAALLIRNKFPAARFVALLPYQIPFALLMGFKEELFFRWGLVRLGGRLAGGAFAAVMAQALIWGVYHGLFGGEHVGSGFWPGFWSWFVACWWGFLACRYRSLRASWLGHSVIEFYGFYLMYIKYL